MYSRRTRNVYKSDNWQGNSRLPDQSTRHYINISYGKLHLQLVCLTPNYEDSARVILYLYLNKDNYLLASQNLSYDDDYKVILEEASIWGKRTIAELAKGLIKESGKL
jgi:hypothetical protein